MIKIKQNNYIYFKKNENNKKTQSTPNIKRTGKFSEMLSALGIYNMPAIHFHKKSNAQTIDFNKLENLNIPNYSPAAKNGVRGESLSSPKNRKFLSPVKKAGITTIIDLRDKYSSKHFPQLCKENGLRYYNIPIDASSIPDETIIKNLKTLFKIMDKENFYIACAQGLHRTDIALSLNYVFNPKQQEPPILKGHFRNNSFKFDDISRRLNSIKKSLTKEDIKHLGWNENFDEEFEIRKKLLQDFNRFIFDKEPATV